jgi:hypothetical protein
MNVASKSLNVSRDYYLKAASECEAMARAVSSRAARSEYEEMAHVFRDAADVALNLIGWPPTEHDQMDQGMVQAEMRAR